MTSANPTLLIGLGAFGRAVTRLLTPPADKPASEPLTELLQGIARADDLADLDPDAGAGEELATAELSALQVIEVDAAVIAAADDPQALAQTVTEDACERARRLLELGYFVDSTAPTDARGPRLDLFVIGDLGAPGAAAFVPVLVATLARTVRRRYQPILAAGEGHLSVCPMLIAPRSRAMPVADDRSPASDTDPGADMGACVRALAALARHKERGLRPQARVYIIEDQSGKYLLPARELARSFAAFLSLVMMSHLRDDHGVRDLVEDVGDDRRGPLATFACATLEIDMDLLAELCAHKLACDMLAHYEEGDLTLSEIAGQAQPLIPEKSLIEAGLWQEGDDGSLEDYLEPPPLPVPDIGWLDAPETIIEQNFGPSWRLEIQHRIDDFRDQVERFKMDRLARRIEKNGTELAETTENALIERIRREALASPRGPARALEFARYAGTRARGFMEQAKRAIDAPNLRSFPDSPLDGGVRALEEAVRAWPRRTPARLWFFGIMAIAIGTFAVGGLLHMVVSLVADNPPHPLLTGAIGGALTASSVSYRIWSHLKRHHNWLTQVRYDIEQDLQRHMQRDLVDYFRQRLEYTRNLWTYRIYRRLTDRLDDLVVQFEGGRAAIGESLRRLRARANDLQTRRLYEGAHGVLYRSVLAPETVELVYRHSRPPDISALAGRYHGRVTGAAGDGPQARSSDLDNGGPEPKNSEPKVSDVVSDVLEAPYADPERALAFSRREFAHLASDSPYEASDSPLYGVITDSVTHYLKQLALKLSPPLEVIGSQTGTAPSASRVVVTPPAARGLIERILADENLDRGWDVRSLSSDMRRIHLLLERGQLPVAAVALARPSSGRSSGQSSGQSSEGAGGPADAAGGSRP